MAQLHLDDAVPFVALDAADEKNREGVMSAAESAVADYQATPLAGHLDAL